MSFRSDPTTLVPKIDTPDNKTITVMALIKDLVCGVIGREEYSLIHSEALLDQLIVEIVEGHPENHFISSFIDKIVKSKPYLCCRKSSNKFLPMNTPSSTSSSITGRRRYLRMCFASIRI